MSEWEQSRYGVFGPFVEYLHKSGNGIHRLGVQTPWGYIIAWAHHPNLELGHVLFFCIREPDEWSRRLRGYPPRWQCEIGFPGEQVEIEPYLDPELRAELWASAASSIRGAMIEAIERRYDPAA